jgi:hypothetical protein
VDRGTFHDSPEWQSAIHHWEESTRGQRDRGDAYSPGWFDVPLRRGEAVVLRASAEAESASSGPVPPSAPESAGTAPDSGPPSKSRRSTRSRRASARARASGDGFIATLRESTRSYLARRDKGTTVIDIPGFSTGDATLIAARIVAGGFVEEARSVSTFGRFETSNAAEFSWRVSAGSRELDAPSGFRSRTVRQHGDRVLDVRSMSAAVSTCSVRSRSKHSNRHGVGTESGLVWSPAFTWMDTNHQRYPREG